MNCVMISMKLRRIFAIVLRYIFLFRRSFDRLSDAFYWPMVDLLLWGLTSTYMRKFVPDASKIILVIISGILLWIIVWRAQYEITVNLLEDLWNRNLINIFVAPLTFWEWITSFIVLGIIKAATSFGFASLIAFILYKTNIYAYGYYLVPFALLLVMTGWWVGFFVAGMILRYGTKIQTLAWTAVMIISPFSAIYYPLSILPQWAQKVALVVPTSYIFEGAREVIDTGVVDINKLWICFGLNFFYLILSLIFIRRSFDKVLDKGLIKVF